MFRPVGSFHIPDIFSVKGSSLQMILTLSLSPSLDILIDCAALLVAARYNYLV